MRKLIVLALALVFVMSACTGSASIEESFPESEVPIFPREKILGDNAFAKPKISPDGSKIAWMSNSANETYILVTDADSFGRPQPVVISKNAPLTNFFWDYTGNIVYYKDTEGNVDYHIHRMDIKTGIEKDLTPGDGFRAAVIQVNPERPSEVAIRMNDRNPEFYDIKRLNLLTGKMDLIYLDDTGINVDCDINFNLRAGTRERKDGGREILRFSNGKWEVMESVGFEDAQGLNTITMDNEDKTLYITDARGRDTIALYEVDIETWSKRFIFGDQKSDVSDWLFSDITGKLVAVASNYEKTSWKVLDLGYRADMDYLAGLGRGDFNVISSNVDETRWIVSFESDTSSSRFYLYDKPKGKARFIPITYGKSDESVLARMHPKVVKSRDGIDLVCYLSLPPWTDSDSNGIPNKPLPMVLNVHGGPAQRDQWGYNPMHQYFANRGYAVLSVNYRGSWGFGKKFLNLGNGEWGRRVQDDLVDSVDWAIENGIAISDKVAIFGGSYGGYAVLAGLAFTPDKFACGVDIVGISNLTTFLRTIPPYWKSYYESWKIKVGGDPDTEEGRKFLDSRSPLFHVDSIRKPLMIGHGANDPRVKVAESEQIVESMEKKGIPVTYCYFPDEGHGFRKWQNSNSFYALVERFLARHLGGRFEPYHLETFFDSSIEVKAGIDGFEGLRQILSYPKGR